MTDISNHLGKMLKQQRVMRDLTLRALAASIGVSSSHLSRIERGNRFPSARILQKIAKPLGFTEDDLFTHAGYLSHQASTTESEPDVEQLDPYVAKVLSEESVEVQRTVLGILAILKSVARVGNPAEWPEFREYVRRKYPDLDEDFITMIEDLITMIEDRRKHSEPLVISKLSGSPEEKLLKAIFRRY